MSNPAAELLEVFEDWHDRVKAEPRIALRNLRGIGVVGGSVGACMRGMTALVSLDERLETLEANGTDVTHLRASMPDWIKMLIAQDQVWSSTVQPAAAFPADAMNNLRSLKGFIGLTERQASEALLREMLKRWSNLRSLLDGDDTLPPGVARTLQSLLDQFRTVLDSVPTEEEVRRSWEAVGVALIAAEATAEPSSKSRWSAARDNWLVPIAAQAVGTAITWAATLAISGGAGVAM